MFTVTLEEALALYAQPKRGRGQTATPPLRKLGEDPTSGKPIVIKDGRFGAYITDGETNRTVPSGMTVEGITFDEAVQLLADKRAAGPAKKRGRKAPAKKTAAKKTAAKKAPAKKAAAKKAAPKE